VPQDLLRDAAQQPSRRAGSSVSSQCNPVAAALFCVLDDALHGLPRLDEPLDGQLAIGGRDRRDEALHLLRRLLPHHREEVVPERGFGGGDGGRGEGGRPDVENVEACAERIGQLRTRLQSVAARLVVVDRGQDSRRQLGHRGAVWLGRRIGASGKMGGGPPTAQALPLESGLAQWLRVSPSYGWRDPGTSLAVRLLRGEESSMAQRVEEIMNPELLLAGTRESATEVLARLAAFDVSGAPVIDDSGVVVGVVSWKDLVVTDAEVGTVMSQPVRTVSPQTSIEDAARVLAAEGHHRLVVAESDGRPVGIVSTQDVVRALVGAPVVHPQAFSHLDPVTGMVWSDECPLDASGILQAPEAPGILSVWYGPPGEVNRVIWVQAADDLRAQLMRLIDHPRAPQHLNALARLAPLRFRVAVSHDIQRRAQALRTLLYRARDDRRQHQSIPNPTIDSRR